MRLKMVDELVERPCVGSGHCCKTAPCAFGQLGASGGCVFLVPWPEATLSTPRYRCGRYAEIVGQPGSDLAPAFGQGCCSSMFNAERRAILGELRAARPT